LFTKSELEKKGWDVEQGKYNYACKSSFEGTVIVPKQKQGPPACKKKISEEVKNKIESWMIKNSTSSSEDSKRNIKSYKRKNSIEKKITDTNKYPSTVSTSLTAHLTIKEKENCNIVDKDNNNINNIFTEEFENNYFDISLLKKSKEIKNNAKEIRIVNETKKKLLKRMNCELNINMKYNYFCKLTKNYKMAKNRTDVCPLCKRLYNLEKKSKKNNEEMNEIEILKQHNIISDSQRSYFNNLTENIKKKECVIVLDFKENWKLPLSKNQIQDSFYHSESITHLCIIVYLTNKKYFFNYFSEDLSHNSNFVIECLSDLLSNSIFDNLENLYIFSDAGPHFRNASFINYIFNENRKFINCNKEINYFAEHHGKNECDGEFGNLTNILNNNLNDKEIKNIDDLISFFKNYYDNKNNNECIENNSNNNINENNHSKYMKNFNFNVLSNLFNINNVNDNNSNNNTYISPSVKDFVIKKNKKENEKDGVEKETKHYFIKHNSKQEIIRRNMLCIKGMRMFLSFRFEGNLIKCNICGDEDKSKYISTKYIIKKGKEKEYMRKLYKNEELSNRNSISHNILNLIESRFNMYKNNNSKLLIDFDNNNFFGNQFNNNNNNNENRSNYNNNNNNYKNVSYSNYENDINNSNKYKNNFDYNYNNNFDNNNNNSNNNNDNKEKFCNGGKPIFFGS